MSRKTPNERTDYPLSLLLTQMVSFPHTGDLRGEAKLFWCCCDYKLKTYPQAPIAFRNRWERIKELATKTNRAVSEGERLKWFMAMTAEAVKPARLGAPRVKYAEKYPEFVEYVRKAMASTKSETAAARKAAGFIAESGIDPPSKNTLIGFVKELKKEATN